MRLMWLLMLFTLGCAKRQGPIMPEVIGDPDVVVSLARSRNKVDVLQGRFSLKLETGEGNYTVPAAVVMDVFSFVKLTTKNCKDQSSRLRLPSL